MRLVPKSKGYLPNALRLLTSTGAAQLIGLAAAPFLTRMYTPQDFGVFAVYSAMLSMFAIAGCLRYEIAIPLPGSQLAGRAMFRLSVVVALAVSFAAALFMVPFGSTIASYYNIDGYGYVIAVIPLSLCSTAVFQAQSGWALREKQYSDLAIAKLGQSIPQTIGQLGLGLLGFGPIGLVAGEIIGRLSGNGMLLKRRASRKFRRIRISHRKLCRLALGYRNFPVFTTGSALLNQGSLLIPVLFITKFYGAQAAGEYALVDRVLALPMNLLGQTISTLYLAEVAALWRKKEAGIRSLFWTTAGVGFMLGIIPGLVLIGFAPELFAWVFGEAWARAGSYAQILALAFVARLAVSPVSQTLAIIGKQPQQFAIDGLRLVAVVSAFLIYQEPYEMIYALIGFSAVTIVFQLVQLVVIDRQVQRMAP